MSKFVFDVLENIIGKGENAGYRHFSPFATLFSKALFLRVIKSLECIQEQTVSFDDRSCVAKMSKFGFDVLENIIGKGENAGYRHFSPFATLFSKALFLRVIKSLECIQEQTMSFEKDPVSSSMRMGLKFFCVVKG